MATIEDLNNIIAKLRKVKYGDYVLSSDYNDLVDSIICIRDILKEMPTAAPAPVLPPSPLSPSGLDPNDGAWTPATGWSKVFQFDTLAELQDWATDYFANADVENSVVYSTVANGMDIERAGENQTPQLGVANYKFAICFAVPWLHMATGNRPISIISTNYGEIDLEAHADSQVKLFIYDTTDGTWNSFWNTFQWLVLLVDFENNVCKVFDHNKNVIFEKTMAGTPGGSNDVFWNGVWQEEWFTADNAISKHWWVFIDWYCEYYAVPQTFY